MKKVKKVRCILIVCMTLITIVALSACRPNLKEDSIDLDEIGTYEESIENGKVEIDGITYDVQYMGKASHTYDDNKNLIKTISEKDGSEIRIEYLYEKDQLMEEKRYSNDKLSYTIIYYYENDLLVEKRIVYDSGLEVRTEYFYRDNKIRVATNYNSDNSIAFIATEYLDDEGRILKGVISTEDGEITDTTTMYYEDDLLVKSIREKADGAINTYHTEYNKLGDKIKEYIVLSDQGENLLIVNFYDIEYNEDLLAETITYHQVQSKIADEDIKDYQ